MWYNRVTFSVDTYVGEPFLKFSTIEKVYISTNIPNYVNFNIATTLIDDQIDWVQLGQSVSYQFNDLEMETIPSISTQNQYPSKWKVCGITSQIVPDQTYFARTSYDVLRMLGDVGGLFGSIQLIFSFLMKFTAEFVFESVFNNALYKQKTAIFGDQPGETKEAQVEKDLNSRAPIPIRGCLKCLWHKLR